MKIEEVVDAIFCLAMIGVMSWIILIALQHLGVRP